jgi:hypothetical protein
MRDEVQGILLTQSDFNRFEYLTVVLFNKNCICITQTITALTTFSSWNM